MQEQTVKIGDRDVTFKFKKLKQGERENIWKEAFTIRTIGGNVETEIKDMGKFQDLLLYYTIVEPSEYKDLVKIKDLDTDVFDELYSVASKVAGFDTDKKK